jgi:hypothetical protein
LVRIFKGFKPLVKNLNNSPKFSLGIIFMNMNFDGITCIQKFEDPIQVVFGLNLIIENGFEFELELWSRVCTVALL